MKTNGPVLEGKGPKIITVAIAGKLDLAAQLVQGEVKTLTPVGVSGGLRGSIVTTGVKRVGINKYEDRVVTPLAHGVVIERGRKFPGPMPPTAPIELWVRRKGSRIGIPQDDTQRMAFLIARKIARRGFKKKHGYKMFEKGLKNKKAEVQKELGIKLVTKVANGLNGK